MLEWMRRFPAGALCAIAVLVLLAAPRLAAGEEGARTVSARVPATKLPLALRELRNLRQVQRKVALGEGDRDLLAKNGFVVTDELVPKVVYEDYVQFYQKLDELKLPIFITSDSVLHYFHVFFDTILMRLEEGYFYDDLRAIDTALLEASVKVHAASSGELREAARRNMATFAVALELLAPGKGKSKGKARSVPEPVRKEVAAELELVAKHKGFAASPLFLYKEDYSQYVPRGHYDRSEKLRRYFLAMMWHGRMTLLAKGSPALARGASECRPDGIVSEPDARIQTLQALLLTKHYLESKLVQEKLTRISTITTFFVGPSDDLGLPEYVRALGVTDPARFPPLTAETAGKLAQAVLALKAEPRIYSGLGDCQLSPPFDSASARKLLARTKGLRLMGQRYTLDSWLMASIVSPYSGEYTGKRDPRPFTWVKTPIGREVRGFPRGLDVMALLGSKRARTLTREQGDADYSRFAARFAELEKSVLAIDERGWFEDLYRSWLHVLQALLVEPGSGYPSFMQTAAWQDKQLLTALASWAELRHDTILHVKQSYTMAECEGEDEEKTITGFVEPVPLLYARLSTLLGVMERGLARHLTRTELKKIDVQFGLEEFKRMVAKLDTIARKQLANRRLSKQEYEFIRDFGVSSETLLSTVVKGSGPRSYQSEVSADALKTTLVADVHTDGNTRQVLEEAVGYVRTLVVAYPTPGGKLMLATGPVFSHYELKLPMAERLTDRAWRERLKSNPPEEPGWTSSFRRARPRAGGAGKHFPKKIFPVKGC
jgi:hypothetical protein